MLGGSTLPVDGGRIDVPGCAALRNDIAVLVLEEEEEEEEERGLSVQTMTLIRMHAAVV